MIPACFICGRTDICSHREPDLVPHWLRIGGKIQSQESPRYTQAAARVYPIRRARKLTPAAERPTGFRVNVTREDALRRRA
jgi:hypothetical protein